MKCAAYPPPLVFLPADIGAPAHYFMLHKNESAFSASRYSELLGNGISASLGSTVASSQAGGMPAPGQPYRWVLPDDPTGINGVANMYTSMDTMMSVYTGYAFLQSIVLSLLMLRLIHYVSFQPRLAIVSGTLARMMPDLIHYCIVFAVIACMSAMILCTVFGYRVYEVRSYSDALTILVEYLILKRGKGQQGIGINVGYQVVVGVSACGLQEQGLPFHHSANVFICPNPPVSPLCTQTLLPPNTEVPTLEAVIAYIVFFSVPMFFTYILLNFFVAQVGRVGG